MKSIQLVARRCEACVFATETDKPSGLTENYLYCELKCCLTRLRRHCSDFIPRRKYKCRVRFYIPE